MSAVDPRRPVDELQAIAAELKEINARIDRISAPSGTSAFQTVAKLSALVADIQAQLDIYNASRYTNVQIDSKDAVVNANIATSISSTLAGNVTVGGQFKAIDAYGFDITYTRRTAWLGNDGRLGYASSSQDKKTSIRPADAERLLKLLEVEPKSFLYRAEVARRTRLRINEGIEYMPPRELGLMAQDLDDAGLGEFVIYGEDGEPDGIEYGMLTVALLSVARSQRDDLAAFDRRLSELEARA